MTNNTLRDQLNDAIGGLEYIVKGINPTLYGLAATGYKLKIEDAIITLDAVRSWLPPNPTGQDE